jgi:hypothetical protein
VVVEMQIAVAQELLAVLVHNMVEVVEVVVGHQVIQVPVALVQMVLCL